MNLAATATTEHSQPTAGHAPPSDISITECVESPPPPPSASRDGGAQLWDYERLQLTRAHTRTHTQQPRLFFPCLLSLKEVAWRNGGGERTRDNDVSVHVRLLFFFMLPLRKAQGKLARPALFTLEWAVTPSCSVSVCFCWQCSVVCLVSLLMLCSLFIVHRVCVQTGWDTFWCVLVVSLLPPDFFFPSYPGLFFYNVVLEHLLTPL